MDSIDADHLVFIPPGVGDQEWVQNPYAGVYGDVGGGIYSGIFAAVLPNPVTKTRNAALSIDSETDFFSFFVKIMSNDFYFHSGLMSY